MAVQLRQHLGQLHVHVGPLGRREVQAVEADAGQVLEEQEGVGSQTA